MKNLVFQVNIKDKNTHEGEGYIKRKRGFPYNYELFKYSNLKAKEYADRVGADYFCLQDYWPILSDKFAATYHKLYIYELFKKYDKIFYIDSDAIVTKICPDIFINNNFSSVRDFPDTINGNKMMEKVKKKSHITNEHISFCAGVILYNKDFYYKTKDKWKETLEYWKDKTTHSDQIIWNILVSKYYGSYNILDPNWGAWYRKGKYITHYTVTKRKKIDVIEEFERFENRLLGVQ